MPRNPQHPRPVCHCWRNPQGVRALQPHTPPEPSENTLSSRLLRRVFSTPPCGPNPPSAPGTSPSRLHPDLCVLAQGGGHGDARKKYIFHCRSITYGESQTLPVSPGAPIHSGRSLVRPAKSDRGKPGRMHTLLQWPRPATPAAPTQSLPSTALATPSPASSTAPAVRCNKMFLRKTLENRPQHTHSKSLTSRQDPLERTVNELPLHPARANQGHRPASEQGSRSDRNPGPLPRARNRSKVQLSSTCLQYCTHFEISASTVESFGIEYSSSMVAWNLYFSRRIISRTSLSGVSP